MDSTLIAGRKLLLADDSLAVQKVIDLTFSDEGMEVTTVGDGDAALQKLEQFAPDVILADVYMPGIDGYSLCEQIKQNERFGRIPVILLVGSFEPFDEAEARRVGADDVVTKPFQSIRQLVSRVGALMGGSAEEFEKTQRLSTLGLQPTQASAGEDGLDQPKVTVMVEAPVMTDPEASEVTGKSCSTDIDLQTADTQQLPPVGKEGKAIGDTSAFAEAGPIGAPKMNATMNQLSTHPATAEIPEALLDLDEITMSASATDDFILDLETEIIPPDELSTMPVGIVTSEESMEVVEIVDVEPITELEATRVETEPITSASVPEHAPQNETTAAAPQASLAELSPEVIDDIARRVVEQLSDKVVRDIAWEVVPELAELLIKQRLDEEKR
jgi:CheY-like chemotaxis protein